MTRLERHLAGGDAGVVWVLVCVHVRMPFGAVAAAVGVRCRAATGHAKQVVQRVAVETARPLGQVAQREAHVEHVVVEAEIAHWHEGAAGVRLVLPMGAAQRRAEYIKSGKGTPPPGATPLPSDS